MGRYEFGPAKPTDVRSGDRPYSNMSWREKDMVNLERRAKSRASSRGGSSIYSNSRPNSGKNDVSYGQLSRHSSLSFLSASEKLMLESDRPRLLHRGTLDRRLRTSSPKDMHPSPEETSRKVTVEINLNPEQEEDQDSGNAVETRIVDPQIESFGEDIGGVEKTALAKSVGKPVTTFDVPDSPDLAAVRLYQRYGSAGSSRSHSPHQPQNSKTNVRNSSAKSGSSYITSVSRMSRTTRSSVTSPHAITPGNTRTVTYGPNSDVSSLMGPPTTPRDIKKEYHHHSAWYHIPGRYCVSKQEYAPKRSQMTPAAKTYQNKFASPSPAGANRKKYSPSKFTKYQQNGRQKKDNNHFQNGVDNFGPTVKGIGPVCTDFGDIGYHDEMFMMGGNYYGQYPSPGMTQGVTFNETVIVD